MTHLTTVHAAGCHQGDAGAWECVHDCPQQPSGMTLMRGDQWLSILDIAGVPAVATSVGNSSPTVLAWLTSTSHMTLLQDALMGYCRAGGPSLRVTLGAAPDLEHYDECLTTRDDAVMCSEACIASHRDMWFAAGQYRIGVVVADDAIAIAVETPDTDGPAAVGYVADAYQARFLQQLVMLHGTGTVDVRMRWHGNAVEVPADVRVADAAAAARAVS
jgi:hypothetical protein